jgi:hypothetical protein
MEVDESSRRSIRTSCCTLDGDPAAWATLAAREGFRDCAITDHTVADLITHN